jgi:predicted dehydrogenase
MEVRRILIVGWGSAGKRFAKTVKCLRPEAQIFVLPNRPGDSSKSQSKSWDFSFVNDWESAIRAEPQVAIIANPAPYHFSAARELADLEIDMLVEKPAASNFEDAHHLAGLLGNRSDVMIGYNLRYLPSMQEFRRQVIRLAEVSEFMHLDVQAGSDVHAWRPDSNLRETVSVNQALGGVLNELSHELDYLSWFLRPPKSIQANLRRVLPYGFDVEDTAHLELHYGRSSGKSDVIATVTLDFTRPQPQRFCVVETDDGQIGWDGILGQILEFKHGEWKVRNQFEKGLQSSYLAQLSAFLEAAESSLAQWPLLGEAVSVCEIIEYARESSQLGTSLSYSRNR